MTINHITMDSFGQDCPSNWEEIAEYLNSIIDNMDDIVDEYGEITLSGRDKIDALWEQYCAGELGEAPAPVFD